MNALNAGAFWAWWTSTEVPVLPHAVVAGLYLHGAWSVILAWLGQRWGGWRVAALLGVWAWVPGVWGVTHWLGLALQSPSVAAVLVCGHALLGRGRSAGRVVPLPTGLVVGAVVLGWVLVADLLAWFPVSLYAWGFAPAALGVVTLAVAVSWVMAQRAPSDSGDGWGLLLPATLLAYATLHLPTGNLWDALLDPWLWVVCHGIAYARWTACRCHAR